MLMKLFSLPWIFFICDYNYYVVAQLLLELLNLHEHELLVHALVQLLLAVIDLPNRLLGVLLQGVLEVGDLVLQTLLSL